MLFFILSILVLLLHLPDEAEWFETLHVWLDNLLSLLRFELLYVQLIWLAQLIVDPCLRSGFSLAVSLVFDDILVLSCVQVLFWFISIHSEFSVVFIKLFDADSLWHERNQVGGSLDILITFAQIRLS